MAEQDRLYDALNDCLERIEAGESIESCLYDYPDEANRLRDLLKLADVVQQAQFSTEDVSEAQERGLNRVLNYVEKPKKHPQNRRTFWLGGLAAAVVLVLAAGVLINQQRFSVANQTATHIAVLNSTLEVQIKASMDASVTSAQATDDSNRQTPATQLNSVQMTATALTIFYQTQTPVPVTDPIGGGVSTYVPNIAVTPSPVIMVGATAMPFGVTPVSQTGQDGLTVYPTAQGTGVPLDSYAVTQVSNMVINPTATVLAGVLGTPAPVTDGGVGGSTPALPTMTLDSSRSQTQVAAASSEPTDQATVTSAPTVTATPTAASSSTPLPPPSHTPEPTATIIPTGIPDMPPDMFFQNYGVNPFLDTEDDHFSTFAMDVDSASYTLTRAYLTDEHLLPPPDAIRVEEFINYFDANYAGPEGDDAFAIHLDAAPAPFGFDGHYLLRVGLQGRRLEASERDPALLVFVIDVSGSMADGFRLESVKEALRILLEGLNEDDRVGIVTYTDYAAVRLQPTQASNKQEILNVINSLYPQNSTNAQAGLEMGYIMAQAFMEADEMTRVILLSDGVANVGITNSGGILDTIKTSVDRGITLTTVGVGMGNYNDVLLEQLANDGNGNYYYVDTPQEAIRVFSKNLAGTLQVIAFNAKVQVDFNPEVTDRYRLLGYENRDVADVDFRNNSVDAGEVGAGHSVTALYELALEGDDPEGVIATVYIRYEDARTGEIVELSKDITTSDLLDSINQAPPSFRLQAGVAEFAEMLRGSYWAAGGSYSAILALVEPVASELPNRGQVNEFLELVRLAIQYGDR